MARYLGLFTQYFVQYAKVRLAYRWDFLISVITMVTATLFGIAFVFLIFGRTRTLGGWSFLEILFLYGFSLLPVSLFNMLSINLYYFSDKYLVQGNFDRVLLRPVPSLFQILFEQFRLESLGDSVLGVFLLWTCARRLDLAVSAGSIAMLAGATLCGGAIYLAVFILLTSVSFWMDDRIGVMPPVYNMIAFGRYPLDIYNGVVRFLLSWVVPFGLATFYPAAAVLRAGAYRTQVFVGLPAVALGLLAISVWVWNRGARNYSSTGS